MLYDALSASLNRRAFSSLEQALKLPSVFDDDPPPPLYVYRFRFTLACTRLQNYITLHTRVFITSKEKNTPTNDDPYM